MKSKLKDKKEVARNTMEFVFQVPEDFSFLPGQYVTVGLFINGQANTHDFSVASSPTEQGIIRIVTRMRESSAFKKALNNLSLGSEVEITEPRGDFVLHDDPSEPLVFVAGGTGITPFLSMLRYIRDKKLDYQITLLYSNSDRDSAVYLDELSNISNVKLIAMFTNEERRMRGEFITKQIPDCLTKIYYIAGPPAMNAEVIEVLLNLGVPGRQIISEDFAGY